MQDRSVPWIILVPQREKIREIFELTSTDQQQLLNEIVFVSRVMHEHCRPEKINVGALGNVVPQLHVHIVGRSKHDRAWPKPIWGTGPIEPYPEEDIEKVCTQWRTLFQELSN